MVALPGVLQKLRQSGAPAEVTVQELADLSGRVLEREHNHLTGVAFGRAVFGRLNRMTQWNEFSSFLRELAEVKGGAHHLEGPKVLPF